MKFWENRKIATAVLAVCVLGSVFGLGGGILPAKPVGVTADLRTPLDLDVNWKDGADISGLEEEKSWDPAVGYVVNWGFAPDKLYHSYQVFDERVSIGGLVKDQALYLRVDSFNENGITEGDVKKII